jgi:hypothetical protein
MLFNNVTFHGELEDSAEHDEFIVDGLWAGEFAIVGNLAMLDRLFFALRDVGINLCGQEFG